MPIQNPICRSVHVTAVGSGFGVSFGVVNPCRSLRRRPRGERRHTTRQNWRLGTPVASAHRFIPCARAHALLQQNEAAGLRALAHIFASFDCNSTVLWPTTHCGLSWVPRWLEQKPRGGQRRKLSCGRSANTFPKMPAARTAPDRLQSALGRFLLLAPPWGGSSLSPALWRPAQTSPNPRSFCCTCSGR